MHNDEEREPTQAELDEALRVAEETGCLPSEYLEYKQLMTNLNKKYAVTMVGSECCVIENYWEPVQRRDDIRFLSFGSFKNKLLNQRVVNPWRTPNQQKTKDTGSAWLASTFRKEYRQVVFDPARRVNPKKYYNLFWGFDVKPKRGSWAILKDHIFENICGGDEKLDHYVKSWMARIIQEPGGSRPGTALVFKGVQGCGKGTLINALGKIIGPSHYRHVLQIAHLTGRFNHHLKDALLVFCDEITWGGDKQTEGILKGLVTEPTVPIEQKGKDVMEIRSHINLAIASNNDWVVPAGLEERRFCVLKCSPEPAGDRKFFNALYEQLENGGYEAMMYDLSHYDYSDIDLRTIPRTKELFEQILSSMSPVHKFWYQRLSDGLLVLSHEAWEREVEVYRFYNAYQDFCDSMGRSYKLILNQFARKLKELCPSLQKARPRVNGAQTMVYRFPDLEQCRNEFRDAINMPVEWETAEPDPATNPEPGQEQLTL